MWELYRLELKYDVYSTTNHLLHILRSLRPFRGQFSDQYSLRGFKAFLSAISGIYRLLRAVFFGIILAFIAYFIFAGLADLAGMNGPRDGTLVTFLFAVYLIMNNLSAQTLSAMQKMYLFHTVFRHPALHVARIELLLEPVMKLLGRAAGFSVVFTLFTGRSAADGLLLSILITALASLGEWIHLRLFQRDIVLQKNTAFLGGMILALAVFMGLLAALKLDLSMLLLHPLSLAAAASTGGLALWSNWNFQGYTLVSQYAQVEYEKMLTMTKGSVRSMDVRLKDSDQVGSANALETDRFAGLTGYEKLNALFFHRHRRILRKPVMIFSLIAAAVGLIGVVVLALDRFYNLVDPLMVGTVIDASASALPFFMYLSIGDKRLTKALFVNCDASLMSYSFYRRPEDILASYRMRLKQTIRLNLPPALALMASLAVWLFGSGAPLTPQRLILFPMIAAYFIFFSIHLLFVYYILQPYTVDLEVRSPLYKVIDLGVYLFCYLPLFLKPDMLLHASFIIVLTAAYAAAVRIILPRRAPQTFRLR